MVKIKISLLKSNKFFLPFTLINLHEYDSLFHDDIYKYVDESEVRVLVV